MRIRSIKPEFFKHDGVAALPPLTRILFVGLWCLADCEGRLEDRPVRIKVELLPYDTFDVDSALKQLAASELIIRYQGTVEGRQTPIIQVASFGKHQRITGKEADASSKFPPPQKSAAVPQHVNCQNGKHLGNNRETPETTGDGDGRETEGKGKEMISSCPNSSSPDGETAKLPIDPTPTAGDRFVEWFLKLLVETGASEPKLTDNTRESWAECYERMLRIDGRTKEQVKDVCRWARNDEFWQNNFMSPMKLREKKDGVMWFDYFANKMRNGAGDRQLTADEINSRRA